MEINISFLPVFDLAPIVGHVGDGNFHCVVLFDSGCIEEVKKVKAFIDRLSRYGSPHSKTVIFRLDYRLDLRVCAISDFFSSLLRMHRRCQNLLRDGRRMLSSTVNVDPGIS